MQSCHLCPDSGNSSHPWQHETWPQHFLLVVSICLCSTETESCMLELNIVVSRFYSLFILKQLFVGIYENGFLNFKSEFGKILRMKTDQLCHALLCIYISITD